MAMPGMGVTSVMALLTCSHTCSALVPPGLQCHGALPPFLYKKRAVNSLPPFGDCLEEESTHLQYDGTVGEALRNERRDAGVIVVVRGDGKCGPGGW